MPEPTLNEAELSASYGFAMAVLNSDPELKSLFRKAVAQTYTPQRFQAELRNTKWFQKNGEAWRNAAIQKAADPATYASKVGQVRQRIWMMRNEMGAQMGTSQLRQFAETAYMLGWDDNQIRNQLGQYVQYTSGRLWGHAGQIETELREWAQLQGVALSDQWVRDNAAAIVSGAKTIEDSKKILNDYAISAYPHLAERIRAGETLDQISTPYRQTMATLLELNPESITMKDPTIKKALGSKDEQGKPALRTLYDFENDLRQDKRWLKTKNAQDAAMETTNRILRDMGLIA